MDRKIIFIRHALTKGNLEKRYVGSTDERILDRERDNLLNIKKKYRLNKSHHNYIISSSSIRCLETASVLFGHRIPDFVSKDLREMNFGDFEYKNFKELDGNPDYQKYLDSGGEIGFPNGESKEEYKKRVTVDFVSMLRFIPSDERNLVFIVHDGTIMAILSQFVIPKKDYFSYHVESLSGFIGRLHYEYSDSVSNHTNEKILEDYTDEYSQKYFKMHDKEGIFGEINRRIIYNISITDLERFSLRD